MRMPDVLTADPVAPLSLKRALKYWDLILYGLAYISPYGVLATLGFVWNASNGLIVLAYVLGAVCMFFTAKSYAVMTETIPTAGSVYGFARHSLGTFWGFIAGWMILLDYLLIPAFVYVLFSVAMSTLLPSIDRGYWIILLVVITTIVNWHGIQVTARANLIAVGLQVIVVVGFVIFAAFALHYGKGAGALTLTCWNSAAIGMIRLHQENRCEIRS
jgi:amino acid transporter